MLQVFAANHSTQQTAPSTRESCTAKCATAASSVLRAMVSVAEPAVCPWTKASTFKRRASECICHPRNIPLSPPSFLLYSRVAYPNRGLEPRKVSSQFLSSPSSLRECSSRLRNWNTDQPSLNVRDPSAWSSSWSIASPSTPGRSHCSCRLNQEAGEHAPRVRRAWHATLNYVPVIFPLCCPCRSTTKRECRPFRDSRFSTSSS